MIKFDPWASVSSEGMTMIREFGGSRQRSGGLYSVREWLRAKQVVVSAAVQTWASKSKVMRIRLLMAGIATAVATIGFVVTRPPGSLVESQSTPRQPQVRFGHRDALRIIYSPRRS
jgi:hypothetical protein